MNEDSDKKALDEIASMIKDGYRDMEMLEDIISIVEWTGRDIGDEEDDEEDSDE